MDPLSLLLRLCAAVPAPRFHTVRYAGVLASASKVRPKIVRRPPASAPATAQDDDKPKRSRYWPWAELMARTFAVDVQKCPKCEGRMKLVAMVQEPRGIRRFLEGLGEPHDVPPRAPARAPPYYRSAVIRRIAGAIVAA